MPVTDFNAFEIKIHFSHFFTLLCSAYYFCNILLIFIVAFQTFSRLTLLGILFLNSYRLKLEVLPIGLDFTYFRGTMYTPKPQLLLVKAFISYNMKTNAVMIFFLF